MIPFQNQYVGVLVTNVSATDQDGDIVTYGFSDGPGRSFVESTDDFKINEFTGRITALHDAFDRETKSVYTLLLVARDNGSPPRQSERYLTILITDVDDNRPEFPKFSNCCTIPYDFNVMENLPPNQFVGKVIATDKDLGTFGIPKYTLEEGGNTNGSFRIDANTGEIFSTGV